ncbi:hypothetical protein GCM10011380_30680 [Sphingomonas metalli]|uniref:PilZ domain-containing protein n=1 Tax=Sphingomonas metalli TaxID=1779358 RepID=A0A916WX07_9SPHN|nr:PilZ domain-containing protein [Sphingomonas metalli]GGB39078.1 hypothetical protein GCM10011380_30680 [Sphingomonas metalli]
MDPVTASPTAEGERRDALRRPVRMRAHLRDREQARFDLDVTDLSATGFRAETATPLEPGMAVWLTLPGLAPLEASVAWRDRFHYACTFARPLDDTVHAHLLGLGRG